MRWKSIYKIIDDYKLHYNITKHQLFVMVETSLGISHPLFKI